MTKKTSGLYLLSLSLCLSNDGDWKAIRVHDVLPISGVLCQITFNECTANEEVECVVLTNTPYCIAFHIIP